ncbi:hypothetical protein [Paraflavitalea sp. CAU 1676]|uniref:hypothetical protein n=1 Tax=Paraflavitalea sp. CAU 1676 TaxID=3032598 RepID=UPI0023D9C014|nr:hypothetical protein [Paraflavitalea sp. CAU 1676]MDF2187689.1 hypothetical protein [Paraflavitalea sp. CAU 1676]
MKVLLRFVLPICLLLLQGYFFLRPTSNPGHHNRVRIILPRGVDQFTAFINNHEQNAGFQKNDQRNNTPAQDEPVLAEVEEEDDDDTSSKKHSLAHNNHLLTAGYLSADLLLADQQLRIFQGQQTTSPTGSKCIFHCVFRI